MKYFGKSNDQFCYNNLWFISSVQGQKKKKKKSFDIAQYSWAKCNCHLNPEVEKRIFVDFVCFLLKMKNGFSVGGQWERLELMAPTPGKSHLFFPRFCFFHWKMRLRVSMSW